MIDSKMLTVIFIGHSPFSYPLHGEPIHLRRVFLIYNGSAK